MEHVNALPAGTRLAEYEVVDVLGAGGFGITYRAWKSRNCIERVLRGGSWEYTPWAARSATRSGFPAGHGGHDYGFRVARSLE